MIKVIANTGMTNANRYAAFSRRIAKVVKCQARNGLKADTGKFPCGLCRSGVGPDSTECVKKGTQEVQWCERQAEANPKFQCFVCRCRITSRAVEDKDYFLIILES
jgi:hypothetical protein